jgi:hypothetical protein
LHTLKILISPVRNDSSLANLAESGQV